MRADYKCQDCGAAGVKLWRIPDLSHLAGHTGDRKARVFS